MNDFFHSPLCQGRNYCVKCRTDEIFRKGIVDSFDDINDPNFKCPYNITKENLGKKLDSGEIKYPALSTQVKNFGKAMFRSAVATVSGEQVVVSNEEQQRRIGLCKQCEFYDAKQKRCRKCGCIARYKAKLKTEHCPLNVW